MKRKYLLKKRGKFWYYKLSYEEAFHSTGHTTRALAESIVLEIIQGNDQGREMITLNDYSKDFYKWGNCSWIERQHAKGRSFSKTMSKLRRSQLENYILPKFGKKLLKDINPVEVENWLISLTLSNQTKNHILYSFNIIMKEAARELIIKFNPLQNVEPMSRDYIKRDILEPKEIKLLFPTDEEELKQIWEDQFWWTLFLFIITTGARSGEVRALKWKNVLIDRSIVLISDSVKSDRTIGRPKSGDVRGVILPERTHQMLKKWHLVSPFSEPEHFVFYGRGGTLMNKRTVWKHFLKGLDNAGIIRKNRKIDVHSLRHTYNTLMRNVLSEALLQFQVGHKSRSMTDRYDQATPLQKIEQFLPEKDKMDAVWR